MVIEQRGNNFWIRQGWVDFLNQIIVQSKSFEQNQMVSVVSS
jgi:IS1 family transposase